MDSEILRVDRTELIARIATAVSKQAPTERRLATPRFGHESVGAIGVGDHRRVQEIELTAELLELDRQIAIELPQQLFDTRLRSQLDVVAQQLDGGISRSREVVPEVRVARFTAQVAIDGLHRRQNGPVVRLDPHTAIEHLEVQELPHSRRSNARSPTGALFAPELSPYQPRRCFPPPCLPLSLSLSLSLSPSPPPLPDPRLAKAGVALNDSMTGTAKRPIFASSRLVFFFLSRSPVTRSLQK